MSDIRYNSEFCIVRKNGTNTVVLSELLTGRVETLQQIEKQSSLGSISVNNVPPLPDSGWIVANQLYGWENQVICCIQSHNRTIYPPNQTPALFSFYRANQSGLQWIENELVQVNWERTYQGTIYKVLQQHMTQQTWNPVATLGTLWQVVASVTEWQIGVAYAVNQQVTYQGHTYKCLQAHTSQAGWTPPVVPALWQFIS